MNQFREFQTVLVQGVDDGRDQLNGLYGYIPSHSDTLTPKDGYVLVAFDYEETHQGPNGLKPEWLTVVDNTLRTFFIQSIVRRITSGAEPNNRDANWLLKIVHLTFDKGFGMRDPLIDVLHQQMCDLYGYPFRNPYDLPKN